MKHPIKIVKGLFKIEDTPEVIAKGFALGSFIGMMPIPGFQLLVAFTIAKLIKVNKKAACVAVFNTNLFTGVFIFAFNYWLGKRILGVASNFEMPKSIDMHFINTILKAGSEVYLSLVVGGIITGVVAAMISYYAIKTFILKQEI